ncbi:MAG: cupin [Enterobacterales bacterium endosymbiont of Blomia tropicalis]|uniref:cupin n=1 Tax=Mixta mediterraneensis TaxID=2758443 RepID=UPI0025A7354E|nr:cupin [Mixta mediterraneensis]MDL4915364.1 cupin [Mixta mediterraneensis]
MTEQEYRKLLAERGFDEPVLVERNPKTQLDNHIYSFEAMALIISGDITIFTEYSETTYHAGETFHLPPDVPYREEFGAQGVTYLSGRKHSA